MKAIVFTKPGGPETLELRDIPIPEPKAGQVRIRVEQAGFNFRDILIREGHYTDSLEPGQPLGIEAVGTIDAVGKDVDPARVGERVVALNPVDGAYAEFSLAPAEAAWPIPGDANAATALGALAQGLTAEFLIRRAAPTPGGTALVHAAAGGVGAWLVHLLKTRGFRVVGLASSPEKRAAVLATGADAAIEPTPEAIAGLPDPVDVVYHTIGGLFEAGLARLAPHGTILVYGAADGVVPALSAETVRTLWLASGALVGFNIYNALSLETDTGVAAFNDLLSGGFTPEAQVYPLEKAADAHQDVEARRTQGKVVFQIND